MTGLRLSLLVLVAWAMVAALAPWLASAPEQIHLPSILSGPGSDAWLGFDDLGRSVGDRLIAGARTSLLVALWVVSVSLAVGALVGTLSGWWGGVWDQVLVRIIDAFLAFPGILLAIALAGVLGPGIENVVIALAAVGWVGFARLARAQTLSLRHRGHVLAAEALGVASPRILRFHLLPLLAAPLIVEATFAVAAVVIAEAGLSFLGLGVQPPAPSWGSMIRDGTRYMLVAPHMVIAPGLVLLMVAVSANLVGDSLRDYLDVRLKDRGE